MKISNDRKLKHLQEEFHRRFPYLKIEFYDQPHGPGQGSPDASLIDSETLVGKIRTFQQAGEMPLDGAMSTGVFEQTLREVYGLNVQVFRKSYGNWLQTWATDVWTLDEQNRRGEIMGDRGKPIVQETVEK